MNLNLSIGFVASLCLVSQAFAADPSQVPTQGQGFAPPPTAPANSQTFPVISPSPTMRGPVTAPSSPSRAAPGAPSQQVYSAKTPTGALSTGSSEDWKGADLSGNYDMGALTGLGLVDSHVGYYIGATAAIKLTKDGFVPDITNPVFLETELAPILTLGAGVFSYSFHLRWDFQKDSEWTFFALGGIGGDVTGNALGGHSEIFPRIGAGAFYRINDLIRIRGEISHEVIGVGVNFELF